MKRGRIEDSATDSRTIMKDESKDDSNDGKPQLCGLTRSHCSINCSNVFAKIDIPRPLEFVHQHLLDFRLIALTPPNPIQSRKEL
jgi:hypothetical protein